MNNQFQIEEMSGYLAARYIGQYTMAAVWEKFELIAEQCERASKDKLLIDFTRGQAEIQFADRYFLGERSEVFALHRLKVAVVATREHIDPEKFAELVARNRGVNVRVFTELQAAVEWLLK
jgi:hypothetical protein